MMKTLAVVDVDDLIEGDDVVVVLARSDVRTVAEFLTAAARLKYLFGIILVCVWLRFSHY